ncbi:hypothetical protein G3580_00605 [Nitrogeniibacter mangrovi]|uniref:Thermostable hemolysin n=1 Tax=Nitrogeniibacter mangrovi TaxID=2016596 RepID=A0A6C1AY18_9RHOO|nr:thermostable hemolysin [Nitrogeniibacter mangrovi]QID16252.1 hypothetical protein G3580_00605 [Nitrogeniibacter mangrovi]
MSSLPALPLLLPPGPLPSAAAALMRLLRPTRRRVRARPAAIPASYTLHEHRGARRVDAERFIGDCFMDSFGSRVNAFMPRLFTVQHADGTVCGAFGLRSGRSRLFLEQYLDEPIEVVLSRAAGRPVRRDSIVEVGHFSGTFPGALRAMIALLTERLYHEGFDWVVFTGTVGLRNAFGRLGLAPIDICAADAERLPADQRAAWGRYYAHAPHVLAGNIHQGFRHMAAGTEAA